MSCVLDDLWREHNLDDQMAATHSCDHLFHFFSFYCNHSTQDPHWCLLTSWLIAYNRQSWRSWTPTNQYFFTRSVKKTQVAWLWGVVSFVPHSRCTKGLRVQHGWFCRWITRWLVWFTAMVNAAPMVNPMVNPIPFPAQLEWGVRCADPSASRTALIHRWHWEWWKTEEQQWHWEWDGRFVFAVLNSDLNWPFSFRDMGGSL